MAEIVFLLLAVCSDSFTACLGLGAERIKIPLSSALIISGTGALFLFISLSLGGTAEGLLPAGVFKGISCGILGLMGILNLLENTLKHFLRKCRGEKSILFSISGIEFALRLYLDETAADSDNSKSLSPKEAAALAGALSLDSLITGFGMGTVGLPPVITAGLSFIAGILTAVGGAFIGKRLIGGKKPRFSWAGGAVLIILAVTRLF